MKKIYTLIIMCILLSSCATTTLVEQWKSPDNETFEANKVLVIAMSSDAVIRSQFEGKLVEALKTKGVIAVKSIDYFETSFTNIKQSEAQLNKIEDKLLETGFDAVLFSKVTGQESSVSMVKSFNNFAKSYESFKDYYYNNQQIYQKEQNEAYKIYTTETALYCICPGKERELLWSGHINIARAKNAEKSMNDYIKLLTRTLAENKMLLVN